MLNQNCQQVLDNYIPNNRYSLTSELYDTQGGGLEGASSAMLITKEAVIQQVRTITR